MPKKNGRTNTNPPYISRVHLKGYKSIIDTKIDLHPGLNIIIGPNGSGKTNFLEFLKNILSLNFPQKPFKSVIELCFNNSKYKWNTSRNQPKFDRSLKRLKVSSILEKFYQENNLISKKIGYKINNLFRCSLVSFNFPQNIVGFDSKLLIEMNKENRLIDIDGLGHLPRFIENFIFSNFFGYPYSGNVLTDRKLFFEKIIIDENFKRNLRKFSPIENIKLDESSSVKSNHINYLINVEFEFKIAGNWLNWNMLSDGTKRIFYLVAEITFNKGVCLVEEPEIGVHPDQYRKILTFLKESAEDKQIIMTTHRPRSLDILKDDELNRIILTRYDKELGTKMRHLTKKEIKQAIKYRENEGSTSELWTYTGFFDEEEVI